MCQLLGVCVSEGFVGNVFLGFGFLHIQAHEGKVWRALDQNMMVIFQELNAKGDLATRPWSSVWVELVVNGLPGGVQKLSLVVAHRPHHVL
jgi:hypothetical protein